VHFELEKNLAELLHKEDCLVYCYGFVAISSSIAAFCKKSDVVFIDERANLPIEQGLDDARSKVVKFAHNDPEDFKAKVEKETKKTRKFLVVEGISGAPESSVPFPSSSRSLKNSKFGSSSRRATLWGCSAQPVGG
jgi:7-keto-8-aminopelargonate synthetase-like enzyme